MISAMANKIVRLSFQGKADYLPLDPVDDCMIPQLPVRDIIAAERLLYHFNGKVDQQGE